jgi:hypothetical protein
MIFSMERKAMFSFKSKDNPKWNISWGCFANPDNIRIRGDEKLIELKNDLGPEPKDLECHVTWTAND